MLIVGAGIIGSALAECCVRRGMSVRVVEAGIPAGATTAAGMGHLVVLDGSPAELALSDDGLRRWQARRAELPAAAEYRACGTLWLARNDAEMAEAERMRVRLAGRGLACRVVRAPELRRLEPELAPGLAGALLRPDEVVIYPPVASRWLLDEALRLGAGLLRGGAVQAVDEGAVALADGRTLRARNVVVAAGNATPDLVVGVPIKPRKGQLVVTERYPDYVRHQLVELGYVGATHGEVDAVAFNVQPRATGQLLIGSSRQYADRGTGVDWPLLRHMLRRAQEYLPRLGGLQGLRAWTGFRPATPDKLPLLGRVPGAARLWLAAGHEGLGITTALASAQLVADLLCGSDPAIDPSPYDPVRFGPFVTESDTLPAEVAA